MCWFSIAAYARVGSRDFSHPKIYRLKYYNAQNNLELQAGKIPRDFNFEHSQNISQGILMRESDIISYHQIIPFHKD